MVSYTMGAVVMYDERMYSGPGHLVYDWGQRVRRSLSRNTKAAAPVRSGELRAKVRATMRRSGVRAININLYSTAHHTMYVIGGTTGPITSTRTLPGARGFGQRPAAMALSAGGGHAAGYRFSVSGQAPNNFMAEGVRRTARTHPSLHGYQAPVAFYKQRPRRR